MTDISISKNIHETQTSGDIEQFIDFPKKDIESSIPERFGKTARKYPGRRAIKSWEVEFTYEQFDRLTNQLAHVIRGKNESLVEPVAFLLGYGAMPIVAIFAIWKAGGFYLPLDPSFPYDRLSYMVEDSGTRLIITNNEYLPMVQELSQNKSMLINLDELDLGTSEKDLNLQISPDTLSSLHYTSGSTGKPKGVLQNHRNLLHAAWLSLNSDRYLVDDRVALLHPIGFAASMTPILGTLLSGATLYPFDLKNELANLAEWLHREQITIFKSVTTLFRHLAMSLSEDEQFPHLRLISAGGETVLKSDVDLYMKHFSEYSELTTGIGGTEMMMFRTIVFDKNTEFDSKVVPVGYPVEDQEVLLLDDEGNEVGFNQEGEIVIRSRYLSPGYWKRPDLTREKFKEVPDHPGVRMYWTGDLGRMREDGCLFHIGRKDFQVKIRGMRVELGEIESVLMQHEGIAEAAVVVNESSGLEKRLVAYLVARQTDFAPSSEELRSYLSSRLPDYMMPFGFVMLDAMPLTATGKINRRVLPDIDEVAQLEDGYIPPRDEIESELVEIWEELLGVSPIGIQCNFFIAGGNSLLAARLIRRVEARFGKNLQLADFLQSPTVEKLATIIRMETDVSQARSLVPLQTEGSNPTLFLVHGGGGHVLEFRDLSKLMAPDYPLYGLQSKGLDGGDNLLTEIKEMAAHYLQEIQTLQTDGPYFIGGYSFGGFVAYEMAHQLMSQGQVVALLAILDTKAFIAPRFAESLNWERSMRFKYLSFVEKFKFLVQSKFHIPRLVKILSGQQPPPRRWETEYQQDGRRMRVPEFLERVMEPEILEMMNDEDLADHYQHVLMTNRAALEEYKLKPYPGKLKLFKAFEAGKGVNYGWEVLALGGVEICITPGGHPNMLKNPHVPVLAEKIKSSIDLANKETQIN